MWYNSRTLNCGGRAGEASMKAKYLIQRVLNMNYRAMWALSLYFTTISLFRPRVR